MAGYLSNIDGTTETRFAIAKQTGGGRIVASNSQPTIDWYSALTGTSYPQAVNQLRLLQQNDDDSWGGDASLHLLHLSTSYANINGELDLYNANSDTRIIISPAETNTQAVSHVMLGDIPASATPHVPRLVSNVLTWEPVGASSTPTVVHQSIEPLVGTATVSITNPGVDYFLKEIHYGSITAWTTGGTRTIQVGVTGTLNKFGGSTITSTSNSAGNHNIVNTNIFQAQKIASGDNPILTYTNTGSAGGSMRVRLVWHKLTTITP